MFCRLQVKGRDATNALMQWNCELNSSKNCVEEEEEVVVGELKLKHIELPIVKAQLESDEQV